MEDESKPLLTKDAIEVVISEHVEDIVEEGYISDMKHIKADLETGGKPPIVVTTQLHPTHPLIWPFTPIVVTCHSCQEQGMTVVAKQYSNTSWILCIILGMIGCWLCCCIPFCVDSMNTHVHTCQRCGTQVGVYSK